MTASREVEVGGGVRSVDVALRWLGVGATMVVIGSVAAREPELAVQICRDLYGDPVIVAGGIGNLDDIAMVCTS